MKKAILATVSAVFCIASANAGSCDDCEKTRVEHIKQCRGDTSCITRAQEAFTRCRVGCNK